MKKKIIIIGEIGVNHNGKFNLLLKLAKTIKEAGADYVKIQSYISNRLCSNSASLAPYQRKNNKINSQLGLLKKFELTKSQQKKFFLYCKKIKIKPLASVFDYESADFIKQCKMNIIKIPSGEINNLPFLKYVSKKFKKIILSTGLSNIKEVSQAVQILKKNKIKGGNLILMQCNTSYPSNLRDSNLNVLSVFKKKFDLITGYSDHTEDFISSITSVGLGARYFEKHVTLSKNLSGPDHKASLNPKQFSSYCSFLRKAEISLGSHIKRCTTSEKKNLIYIRKSIYAKKKIIKGELFTKNNLTIKRPALGLKPSKIEKLLGKKSKNNYYFDKLIKKQEIN